MTESRVHLAPAVLNVKDAAAYLGVSARTMYRLSAQCGTGPQDLPVVHVRGRRVFAVADLDAYLERQRSTATRPVLPGTRRGGGEPARCPTCGR